MECYQLGWIILIRMSKLNFKKMYLISQEKFEAMNSCNTMNNNNSYNHLNNISDGNERNVSQTPQCNKKTKKENTSRLTSYDINDKDISENHNLRNHTYKILCTEKCGSLNENINKKCEKCVQPEIGQKSKNKHRFRKIYTRKYNFKEKPDPAILFNSNGKRIFVEDNSYNKDICSPLSKKYRGENKTTTNSKKRKMSQNNRLTNKWIKLSN